MRRPYIEPGLRSARPGIRHRSRSNGPDRKGRDPTSLASAAGDRRPLPARLASEDGSHFTETEDEAFFSGEDTGALTHPEEDQDDQEDRSDEDSDRTSEDGMGREVSQDSESDGRRSVDTAEANPRPAPAIGAASTSRTPNRDNDRFGSNATLTRSRAYSAPRKLAPEEEDWALKSENKRRKGGVFGRLKRLGRGKKDNDAAKPSQAYDADAILGRSHSAVTELRSRRSFVQNRERSDSQSQRATLPRSFRGRSAAAAAIASGTAAGAGGAAVARKGSRSALDGEDTFSESGTAVRASRAPVDRPSPIASEDELSAAEQERLVADVTDDESGRGSPLTPIEISDQPPRIGTPIALREAENARSPELIDPYGVSGNPTDRRAKSLAESVQPSVLDADGASMIPPSSPLLPLSGPLSHQDAVLPSGRPSMQSLRDLEIDQENEQRPRTASSSSNLPLKSAAGGALGGLAAMIGFDALREDENGVIRDTPPTVDNTIVSRDLADAPNPLAELESTEQPMKIKKKKSKRADKAVVPAVLADGTSAVDAGPPANLLLASGGTVEDSELPYIVDAADPGAADNNVPKKEKKSKKSKKSKAAALAVPGAIGVGIGGLAAAVDPRPSHDEERLVDTTAADGVKKQKKKSSKNLAREAGSIDATAVGGASDDAVILSNIPASNAVVPEVADVPAEDGQRKDRKKHKRAKKAALAAGVAAPIAVAAPAISNLVDRDTQDDESSEEESLGDRDVRPPPFEATYPDEKANYSSLGMIDAAAPNAAAVPAVLAARPSRKASKRAKGSRPVDKMPVVVDEEEQSTLAPPQPRKKKFLLTPSIAPSVADPLDSGLRSRSIRSYLGGDWLSKSLSPQQTHYFLRELSLRELRWELDRAWLLTSFDKPTRETLRDRRQVTDYEDDSRINDFDDTSDEDLLAMETDEDEEAVFRGQLEHQAMPTPDLPLLRFLLKNAFSTFPLFVAPEDKLHSYGANPPDKATIARSYFLSGLLPILRAIQARSLSAPVDRHGEGDGTPFSARSTTGAVRTVLLKWASKYITAVLRVGPGDPYFGDEEPLDKDSWPWPAPNLLPPEAYYAYRKPLDRLKYGGYEVDVVGVRRHSPTERDYILRIRRPNRLDEYVVRNDADFDEFQRSLSKELGAHSFVRPLPKTGGRPNEDSDYDEESPYSSLRSSNLNHAGVGTVQADRGRGGSGRGASGIQRKPSKAERSLADRFVNGQRDRARRYSIGVQNGRPVLSRRGDAPEDDRDDVFESDEDASVRDGGRRQPVPRDLGARPNAHDDEDDERSERNARRYIRRDRDVVESEDDDDVTESGRDSGRGGARNTKPKKSRLPFGLGSISKATGRNQGDERSARGNGERTKGDTLDSRRRNISRNLPGANNSRGSVYFRDGPPSYDAAPARRAGPAPPAEPMDFEARRNKLRSWLRDTLAVREAGHAAETQDFTSIASFPEKALRRSDLLDMDDRIREDKHRRREHDRDAQEAGDDVHDLRNIRDDMWVDCVDGDGFLKIYDKMVETPDYGRLPLNYQQMVSWGNLQLARFLYGAFVAGDESRANLARLQDVYESVPWKKLSLAMKAPVSQMLRSWQDNLLRKGFLQAILHVVLEDEPETIEEDLAELRRSIGSDVMFRKLRMFVDSPDDLKRLIRQHAEKAEIPLVAAIVRGSEQPKLNKTEVQRVMDATEAYQDFMKTQPSIVKKNAHKEPGFMLIRDLQRALRLFSLQRDGAQVRGMLQDPAIADALAYVFEPLLEELRRMHRVKGISGSIIALERFLGRLIDHLSGLRARVQDPARSIHGLAEMLDGAAPTWYAFLYKWSDVSPTVFSFFAWFRHLAMTVGAGSTDLAEIWTDPPAAPRSDGRSDDVDSLDGARTETMDGALDAATMRDINSLAEYGRRKRNRQMEIACRWAAGETEEHHSVQVQGDGAGKTRTEPYLPKEPRPARAAPGLDRFRKSFREAVSQALAR